MFKAGSVLICFAIFILCACNPRATPAQHELLHNLAALKTSVAQPNDIVENYNAYVGHLNQTVLSDEFELHQKAQFWIPDFRNRTYKSIQAELVADEKCCRVWLDVDDQNIREKVEATFNAYDQNFSPKIISTFQALPHPGIDGDTRSWVIVSHRVLGNFFHSFSQAPKTINPFSNQHEMLYLNASGFESVNNAYPVIGHEIQHLVHWLEDPDEETWVTEGLSTYAETIIDPDTPPLLDFNRAPDTQLNTWDVYGNNYPHYGSAFLYFYYLAEQFGAELISQIVAQPQNGLDGIDLELNNRHLSTNDLLPADQVFLNWSIANILNRPDIEGGKYGYKGIVFPGPFASQKIEKCNTNWLNFGVHQYGTDYLEISCSQNFQIEFKGRPTVKVVTIDPKFSQHFFLSAKVNESTMTLTKQFDFREVKAQKIQMNFWVWYDLEQYLDFAYIRISKPGTAWKVILPDTIENECSLDGKICGFTGLAHAWRKETIDISECAGSICTIQFVCTTDIAATADGFSIGRISIPAIHYEEDFHKNDGGWTGAGFVRVLNDIPQEYGLTLIKMGATPEVEHLTLDPENYARTEDLKGTVILAVSGLTRYTTQLAPYQLRVISAK